MKVQELIDKLNTYPPDETVHVEVGGPGTIYQGEAATLYSVPGQEGGVCITTEEWT